MNKHVWGTLALGYAITALLTVGVYMAGFPGLAFIVAGFFGACTGCAAVADYYDQKERRQYDEEHLIEETDAEMQPVYVGGFSMGPDGELVQVEAGDGGDAPPEIQALIRHIIKDMTGREPVLTKKHEPVLSEGEISEIEEKFS